MKSASRASAASRFATLAIGLGASSFFLPSIASAATTGFNQTGAGPFDYNTTGNWAGGTINGLWDSSLTLAATQTATFAADTTLTTGLTFNNAGNFALTLRSDGTANRTLTLGGDISVATTGGTTANVTIGSGTANQNLNVDLGGVSRSISVASSRTLTIANVVSNGSISKTGAGTLILNGANTFAGGLTLSAGQVTIGNNAAFGTGTLTISGGTIDVSAARTTTNAMNWNGDFTYAGSNGWTTNTGAVTLGSSRQVTVSASTLTIGGVIGEASSGYSLTKTGAGTMVLNGANTYSGGTTVNAGVLTIGAAGTLGTNVNTNNVTVSGALLNLGAATSIGGNQTLTVGSSSTVLGGLGVAFNSLPTFTQSGADPILIAINTTGFTAFSSESAVGGGNIFLGSTGTGTYAGSSLGAGSDGIYRLGGGGGTLTVANAVLSGSGSLVVGSALTNGGGTVVLQGANSLSGVTSVNAGTLKLSGASGALASSTINVTSGTTLNFDSSTSGVGGATRASSVKLNGSSLTVNGNSGANSADAISNNLTISGSGGGYDIVSLTPNAAKNTLLQVGSLARSDQGVVLFRGTNLGSNTIASATANNANIQVTGTAPTLVGGGGVAGSSNISIIPWAVGGTTTADTGSTFVTYDAANGIRPLNTSTEFSATVTDGATTTNNIRLAPSTDMAFTSTTTINSLIVQPTATSTISGGTLKITSGAIFLNPANTNLTTTISSNLDFGTAQGVIGSSNNRASNLTGKVSGSGGLVFYSNSGTTGSMRVGGTAGNTSDYTGDTYILANVDTYNNAGTLYFPNGTRTGDMYVYAQLSFADGGQIVNGLNGNGVIAFGHSQTTATFTFGDNNANGAFSGTFATTASFNSFSLIKIGSGTQELTGTNSYYAGSTTIKGGTLAVAALADGGLGSSIGSGANTANKLVIDGGTLKYTGVAANTDRLFTVGSTTAGAIGTLDASGTGAVNFTNTGSLAYGTNNQTRTLALTGNNTGANTLAATIANNGTGVVNVTKAGSGTWTLSSATNSYTGATTISGGTLNVSGSIASSATTVGSGATLALSGSGTVGTVTVNSGTFQLGTAGTAGAVTINDGTLGGSGTVNSLAFTGTSLFGPGNSPGTVTIANGGAFTLSSGTTSTFQFTDSGFGVGTFDLVTTSGTATGTIAGTLNLDFTGSGYTAGSSVTFINLSSISGTFSTVNVTGLSGLGLTANVSYNNAAGDVYLTLATAAVPEPSTYAAILGALALAGVVIRRRRQTR